MVQPKKNADTLGPLYALHPTSYCRTCGRVNSSRKHVPSNTRQPDTPKFCSTRCKHNKPAELDRAIENVFVALLDGDESTAKLQDPGALERFQDGVLRTSKTRRKGDPRVLVRCSDVLEVIGGGQRPTADSMQEHSCRIADNTSYEMNTETSGKPEQQEGMRLAKRRENVKRAARRLVVFGHVYNPEGFGRVDSVDTRTHDFASPRYCEVVSNGNIVDPSFAKGDWGIRWRQE